MISIRSARNAGVPLLAIETADPQQTILNVTKDLNGKLDEIPVVQWDFVRAFSAINDKGGRALALFAGNEPQMVTNPTEALSVLAKAPAKTIAFFHNAHRFWSQEAVMQGIWNLRDEYKASQCMLIMLCPLAQLPDELRNDVIVLTETLPTTEEVDEIAKSMLEAANKSLEKTGKKIEAELPRVRETLLGLSAFCAEQVLAMSISAKGIDMDSLWERKRKMIEQTPGLSVWRGGETFEDVGGYANAKSFMRRLCKGNAPPSAILYIDEIDKGFAAVGSDSSGTSQDQHAVMLKWMQDSKNVIGAMFVGPPGSGKSLIAKATGNDAGIPTIAFDLGAMKGSLVGQSEQRIRAALQVVDAVAQGNVLVIATCNQIAVLPPELKRRFSFGTFFFPLPDKETRAEIWKLYTKKFQITPQKGPADDGWTGAEIRNCCLIAWKLGCSLVEAAGYVVPVSVAAAAQIEKLCTEAHRRYINADRSGLYEYEKLAKTTGRKMKMTQ